MAITGIRLIRFSFEKFNRDSDFKFVSAVLQRKGNLSKPDFVAMISMFFLVVHLQLASLLQIH